MEKKLTIVIPTTGQESERTSLKRTIESLPWSSQLEVILYSDHKENTIDLIKECQLGNFYEDSEESMSLLVVDYPGSDNLKKAAGIEDALTDYITFLKAGDEITEFNPEVILSDTYQVRFGGISGVDILEKACSSMALPEKDSGIIYSVGFLKRNNISPDINSDTNVKFLGDLWSVLEEDFKDAKEYYNLNISEYYRILSEPTERINLSNETKTIKDCIDYWESLERDGNTGYLRLSLWGKIQRSASRLCSWEMKDLRPEYSKYLNPDNLDIVLK